MSNQPPQLQPRKTNWKRSIAIVFLLIVLAFFLRELFNEPPALSTQTTGTASAASEKKPIKINEKAQAWEVVEVGDEVSLKYPGTKILCESRDEASKMYYVFAKTVSDALYAGDSSSKAIQKGWDAQKKAMRNLSSCSQPRERADPKVWPFPLNRYRVERKEISGTKGDVFHTVYHCLQPAGEDRCVWLVTEYTYSPPFENVRRPQPVAQTSDTKRGFTMPAPEQSAAAPAPAQSTPTAPEQSAAAPAPARLTPAGKSVKIRTRTPGCEDIATALNTPMAERIATETDRFLARGEVRSQTCQFYGGQSVYPSGERKYTTWLTWKVPGAVLPPLPPGKVAICITGGFLIGDVTSCDWVIVSQQDVCEVDYTRDYLGRECWERWSTAVPAPEQSAPTPAPEQPTAARAPEQSAPAPAPEQPRGWIAEVKKSRPICPSADDYVQFHRTSFDIAKRPSHKAMQKAIEFVKRKCPIATFEPGDHVNVERTETFSIDKTSSITLACVVIKDGPCAWTDASQLVRISEEAPAKKSTQSHTKSVQDAFEERPEQPQDAAAKAARPRRGKRGNR